MVRKRRRKHWSKRIEESGIRVRLYERAGSSSVWFSVIVDGSQRRGSLQTGDRSLAQVRARAVAREMAEARLTGRDLGSLTLGQLFGLYRRERLPFIEGARKRFAETRMDLFTEAWRSDLAVLDISQAHLDRYASARRSGALAPDMRGRTVRGARDGTIDGDFRWLSSVFNFGRKHRINRRPVLFENPLDGLTWSKERQPQRPVASHERYLRIQEHTDTVDPSGRLRCILALARYSGRRESAICRLTASDVLRKKAAIEFAMAEAGMDERVAEYMPHGAIRWPRDTDKQGFLFVAPLSRAAREEVDRYLRKSPRVGNAPLFPGTRGAQKHLPIRRDVAARWLLKAERLAGLPKLQRGVFHPFRRLWATERKGLPAKDVAHAGGWKDVATMEFSYQGTDPATVLRVVESSA